MGTTAILFTLTSVIALLVGLLLGYFRGQAKAAADSDAAAKSALDITQYQLKDGYSNTLALLNAEQAYQQAHIALLSAEASRYADTAALFQALGGGWWHRSDDLGEANAK